MASNPPGGSMYVYPRELSSNGLENICSIASEVTKNHAYECFFF